MRYINGSDGNTVEIGGTSRVVLIDCRVQTLSVTIISVNGGSHSVPKQTTRVLATVVQKNVVVDTSFFVSGGVAVDDCTVVISHGDHAGCHELIID